MEGFAFAPGDMVVINSPFGRENVDTTGWLDDMEPLRGQAFVVRCCIALGDRKAYKLEIPRSCRASGCYYFEPWLTPFQNIEIQKIKEISLLLGVE